MNQHGQAGPGGGIVAIILVIVITLILGWLLLQGMLAQVGT